MWRGRKRSGRRGSRSPGTGLPQVGDPHKNSQVHFVPKHSDVALICAKDILGRNDMVRSKILYHSK